MMPKISVCIPAYEMAGRGADMLRQALQSVRDQDYPNTEIVVSDHTARQKGIDVCAEFGILCAEFGALHVPFTSKHGNSSANLNNAIDHASGEYIKPMMQDDLFAAPNALSRMYAALEGKGKWSVAGYKTFGADISRSKPCMWPPVQGQWNALAWNNNLGTPTGTLYRACHLRFDERLIWHMDCDFYYQLYLLYGNPCIVNDHLVLVRVWSGSVTNTIVMPRHAQIENQERRILDAKYKDQGGYVPAPPSRA